MKFLTTQVKNTLGKLKKKLWEEYGLKEEQIQVEFNPPTSFHALREQQIFEVKSGNFSNMSGNELISNTFCQKKYLGWTDDDVLKNRGFLKKDKEFQWELGQIEAQGPNWRDAMEGQGDPGMDAGMGDMGMGGDSAMPAGDLGGAAPDFGPAPDVGADDTAAPPPAPVE